MSFLTQLVWLAIALAAAAALGLWRLLAVIRQTHDSTRRPPPRAPTDTASIAIFLGSGTLWFT
jgi:hypothetical protein